MSFFFEDSGADERYFMEILASASAGIWRSHVQVAVLSAEKSGGFFRPI